MAGGVPTSLTSLPADTTTQLNAAATPGDVMDESAVTQFSGTTAKRPRIVLGDDVGQLLALVQRVGLASSPVVSPDIEAKLDALVLNSERQTKLLFFIAQALGHEVDIGDLDEIEF